MKTLSTFAKQIASILALTGLLVGQANAQEAPKLSDAEVAHVAVTANKIDISYAKIAKERSNNEKVLNFAQTMIDDHSAIIGKAAALAKKLGVTAKNNAVSKSLMAGAKKTKDKLTSIDSDDFDLAYVKNEVAYHKAVINAVKNVLIPQTDNDQLKSLLKAVLPLLESHLDHAEMVYSQLKAH